ncbi:MAG: CRISPR-associated endonuclease Cas3'', partial [Chloroflexota bacterium]|nr:CRISPR-associated endonuclease Cas3'' [Chloroflexota bacterium]
MELGVDHFADFFRAIHGDGPFPWQDALVARLDETDEWPDVLDLPTGSGKTAALDAAVFHLALRWKTPRKSALRIALVVDRRLVVDDAFARADRIAIAVANPGAASD